METCVGCSATIDEVRHLARCAARSDAPVLVTGETGTGKEVLARLIHRESARATAPFVAINCAALPESLIESELFGHVRGAFTGATRDAAGCFVEARGGTLFLDEIGEMDVNFQTKLLRVLQDGCVRPVGGRSTTSVDVRIVAATNRGLDAVGTALRSDLYYRLAVVELHLPPLRERVEDIPLLAEHFLRTYADRNAAPLRQVSNAAMDLLIAHDWPGNVRELENVLERATVLAAPDDGPHLEPRHLPLALHEGGPTLSVACHTELDIAQATRDLRARLVREALRRTAGNRAQAARLLGTSRRHLYNLMEESDGATLPFRESPFPPPAHAV